MRYQRSQQAHLRASHSIVGGVNSPVRSFNRVGKHPLFASHAQGAYLWDLDGHQYIDFVLSYGPHLFGHAHPKIVAAVSDQLSKGMCFGMSGEIETKWAEALLKHFPPGQKVRAMSSGTEACMTAIRLARGATGREVILKFSGHYHGHVDWLMVDSGSGIATLSGAAHPDSAGLPSAVADSVRVLPFNDVDALESFFETHGSKLAGVILEPVMGNMGVVVADRKWIRLLETLCRHHKVMFILDEVMTGFRVGPRSAQGLYELKPDLTCLGKVVGGGLPVSALLGRADLMDHLAPLGSVYQAGTLSGNPVGLSAGLAMLELMETEEPFEQLEEIGTWTKGAFEDAIARHKIKACVVRCGTMLSVFFRQQAPQNAAETRDINHEQFVRYFWAMIEQGLMIPPSPYEAYFLSTAHKMEIKSSLEEKLDRVFRAVAEKI